MILCWCNREPGIFYSVYSFINHSSFLIKAAMVHIEQRNGFILCRPIHWFNYWPRNRNIHKTDKWQQTRTKTFYVRRWKISELDSIHVLCSHAFYLYLQLAISDYIYVRQSTKCIFWQMFVFSPSNNNCSHFNCNISDMLYLGIK